MLNRFMTIVCAVLVCLVGSSWEVARATGQAGSSAAAQPSTSVAGFPKAEDKFKNIQVLKGFPADQVIPSMHFISDSLGVECSYCHVQSAFDKDDKQKKKIARRMITMQLAINKDNFNSHTEVTCNTCHRGAAQPVAIPIVAETAPTRVPVAADSAAGPAANAPAGPSADQILGNYLQAVGGADALRKFSSRVQKGTVTGLGPTSLPIEIYAKAPNQQVSIIHTPRGERLTVFDGHAGWVTGFGAPRELAGGDLEAARLDADFYFPSHLKELFTQFRARPAEKIGDREAFVVYALKEGQPPVRFYFDEQSGLLVRLVSYTETFLGRNPTEITFADYRDTDGVKLPYHWTIARPPGRTTVQVDQIQQNVPIDDARFAKPPTPATPPASPTKPASP